MNITKLGAEAQADHELDYSERMGRNVVEVDPWARPRPVRGSDVLSIGLVIGGGWSMALLVFTLARLILGWGGCYSTECYAARALWWMWLASPVVITPVVLIGLVGVHVMRARVESARVEITRDRYGNPVSAMAIARQTFRERYESQMLAASLERDVAPYRIYRGADALTINQAQAAAPAAPATILNIGPLQQAVWLAEIDSQPHTLLAAKTGGGKSTMARYLLARRIESGGKVFIIDPHWSPGNWWSLPGHGGGESWDEIKLAFETVYQEYKSRLEEFEQGRETDSFQRLTVLVDEAVITRDYFERQGKNNPWTRFITVLGSGARKVRISVILMTQSANVSDLGLSGPMRENYSRIALDTRAIRQLIEDDKNTERKKALAATLPEQGDYPAAMEIKGEVFYLDRSTIRDVPRPAGADAAVWLPVRLEPVTQDAPEAPSEAPVRTDGRTDGADTPVDRETLLKALRRSGKTRDEARELFRSYGMEFENAMWTEVGRA